MTSPSQADLGARVRAARVAAGLTQSQAADRLRVGQSTQSDRERATTLPYADLLAYLAAGFDPSILCPELTETLR